MVEIGVDIGGTFTDVICRSAGAPDRVVKVPTTRGDPSRAVLAAVARLKDEAGIEPGDIVRFVHGTTVATNAVLERKGPKIGLLTTEGFKDILEIGRQLRHDVYRAVLEAETPVYLAHGRFRHEIPERVAADGTVLTPLDEEAVLKAAEALVADGVEGIAIVFLFSFLEPAHERRAAELIAERWPDLALSLSCDVDPAFREYERTVVTAFDAYIKPVIDRYLANLEAGLEAEKVPAPLQIMQSRGGITAAETARQRPVRLFLSGPAAGVAGAQAVGAAAGVGDLISVDIGGTSSDIALIRAGKPMIRPEGHVGGYDIRVPMVDVNAIGAGGGSLAWIDASGGLRVGPHSAGSEPGPVAYGRGGTQPTVTDASIVLGYIDPNYFVGGTMTLDPERARAAIEKEIAAPLGLSVERAALGIHRVVNAGMTEGIRLVSIRQGYDPREFALLPLGGAGGIHAAALSDELAVTRFLVALHPGVLSATGLLSAEIEHEIARAFPCRLAQSDPAAVAAFLDRLDGECAALMAREGSLPGETKISYSADICFVGQSHYLEIPFSPTGGFAERLDADFRADYQRVFGHAASGALEIVNLRAIHRAGHGGAGEVPEAQHAPRATTTRRIVLPGYEAGVEARVVDRQSIAAGDTLEGPLVIEQADTTTLVPPGWRVTAIASGILDVKKIGAGERA
ncbi:hydantoinase/oxoprolinase family protein [Acuticoccus sediminis]|uniref:hydantoinase/oxoprolinase family protein n=1 Tax=Acuticoccus sediminis TaxID=2184697 RepID=UPI001CFCF70C|nr:hydantoinase/oxoprolinase family protein [Acuticoccus sediminis]